MNSEDNVSATSTGSATSKRSEEITTKEFEQARQRVFDAVESLDPEKFQDMDPDMQRVLIVNLAALADGAAVARYRC